MGGRERKSGTVEERGRRIYYWETGEGKGEWGYRGEPDGEKAAIRDGEGGGGSFVGFYVGEGSGSLSEMGEGDGGSYRILCGEKKKAAAAEARWGDRERGGGAWGKTVVYAGNERGRQWLSKETGEGGEEGEWRRLLGEGEKQGLLGLGERDGGGGGRWEMRRGRRWRWR